MPWQSSGACALTFVRVRRACVLLPVCASGVLTGAAGKGGATRRWKRWPCCSSPFSGPRPSTQPQNQLHPCPASPAAYVYSAAVRRMYLDQRARLHAGVQAADPRCVGELMQPDDTFRLLGFLHAWMMALNRLTAVCRVVQAGGCSSRDGLRAWLR